MLNYSTFNCTFNYVAEAVFIRAVPLGIENGNSDFVYMCLYVPIYMYSRIYSHLYISISSTDSQEFFICLWHTAHWNRTYYKIISY